MVGSFYAFSQFDGREERMQTYTVRKLSGRGPLTAEVPGSKSITNRALLLAALSEGACLVRGALFSDDSRAFLSCLSSLGFSLQADEAAKTVRVGGCGGVIPRKKAEIDVRSAGTAARFLTVMLAFAGGEYLLRSSPQMERRPMEPLLGALRRAGAEIDCLREEGHFPFRLHAKGLAVREMTIDTDASSQFASALLMCAPLLPDGLTLHLTGGRTEGAYIGITAKMLSQFGIQYQRSGADYFIPAQRFALPEYAVEPDFSAADYFFAAGALLGRQVTVRGVRLSSMQGDAKFLGVLEKMGCSFGENAAGVWLAGPEKLTGVHVNMNDFSDQALTLAAVAPFASSPTVIEGIGHIRGQECDRIRAMCVNLTAMGVKTEERADGVTIFPCDHVLPARIQTFGDHRVAMSFAVAGLKCGGLVIEDPACCKKTFENFFTVLEGLYRGIN